MRIEAAFEAAHEAALLNSADLVAGLGDKFIFPGAPPTNQPVPYVLFEKPQVIDQSTECLGAWEIFATTRVFAKRRPQLASPAELAGICREVLAADLGLAGFRTVDFKFVESRPLTSPDGSTGYAITHRYLIEASA